MPEEEEEEEEKGRGGGEDGGGGGVYSKSCSCYRCVVWEENTHILFACVCIYVCRPPSPVEI